jgi:hypothetical protein
MAWTRLADTPDLWIHPEFLDPDDAAGDIVVALFTDPGWCAAHGLYSQQDDTGFCAEAPVASHPILLALRRRLAEGLGLPAEAVDTVRFRWYRAGEGHPPHVDAYSGDELELAVTALVYLGDADEGGETLFDLAAPAPVRVAPTYGTAIAWNSLDARGGVERASRHRGIPVVSGEKGSLLFFFWLPSPVVGLKLIPPEGR